MVSGQEIAHFVGSRGPARAQHADALVRRPIRRAPVFQQIVEDRIQMLAGRVPGLQEKVVNVDFIDGVDGGAGVGIGGQQGALGVGIDLLGFVQKADAIHVRHTLIGQAARATASLRTLSSRRISSPASPEFGAQHPVVLTVTGAQVSLDRFQNIWVVVYGQQRRLGHARYSFSIHLRCVQAVVRWRNWLIRLCAAKPLGDEFRWAGRQHRLHACWNHAPRHDGAGDRQSCADPHHSLKPNRNDATMATQSPRPSQDRSRLEASTRPADCFDCSSLRQAPAWQQWPGRDSGEP